MLTPKKEDTIWVNKNKYGEAHANESKFETMWKVKEYQRKLQNNDQFYRTLLKVIVVKMEVCSLFAPYNAACHSSFARFHSV